MSVYHRLDEVEQREQRDLHWAWAVGTGVGLFVASAAGWLLWELFG